MVPSGQAALYSERLVRLPDSYQINDRDPPCAAAPSRAAVGLPEGRPVLACFCGGYKIDRQVFRLWCDILAESPAAVLWLLADSPATGRNLRAAAAREGLAADRLILADPLPKPAHLARVGLADLFLDTLVYGAHTTASDALWAGVPVVTRLGDAFASRVGASVVRAHGLPELVVEDLGAYRRLAVALANDPQRLAALRARTRANRATMPLFDTARGVRHLERAYLAMWRRHAAGLPPDAIDIPAEGT